MEGDKPDWKSFNHPDNVIQDLPNESVFELLRLCVFRYKVVIVTGRMESQRAITNNWIVSNCPHVLGGSMFMRPDGDYRPDHEVKEEILHKLQADGHDIIFTVDDRDSVVAMWRRNGITCLQVAEGNF